jgi:hypothetical protein
MRLGSMSPRARTWYSTLASAPPDDDDEDGDETE